MSGTSAAVGQQVVHERARLEVGLVVVDRLLVQHRADALHHAAADLPVDDGGVDELAAVLDRDVAVDVHAPGVEVDLDPAHVGRLRPAALAAVVVEVAAQRLAADALLATSANDTEIDGTPATWIAPSSTTRSSRGASSRSAATSRICSRSARAEYVTAPPAIGAERLPPVPDEPERRDARCRRSARAPARSARRARRPRPGPGSSRGPARGASAACTPTRCRRPRAPSAPARRRRARRRRRA